MGFLMGSPHITVLAIGPNNSYFCRNNLGQAIQQNLPKGLDDALTGRKNSLPEVQNVNLGERGEWFVRFLDGSWRCSGHTDGCDQRIEEIKEEGQDIHEILFGNGGIWMIRYTMK